MLASLLLLAWSCAAEPVPATVVPPLARDLLQPGYDWEITGARLTIRSGLCGERVLDDTLTAADLPPALSRVPEAATLAHGAHQRLWIGRALTYGGMGLTLVGVVSVATGAAQATNSGAQWGLGTAGGLLAVAGIAAWIAGAFAVHDGLAKVLEAVNAYNLALARTPDLTSERLTPQLPGSSP